MIQLLHNGNLVALGSGIGRAFCGGGGCLDSGGRSGGIGGGAAGGQRGHHSGSGQNSNKLSHGKFSFICKTGTVVVAGADIDRPRADSSIRSCANRSADSFYKFRLAIVLSSGSFSCFPLPSCLKSKLPLHRISPVQGQIKQICGATLLAAAMYRGHSVGNQHSPAL